ncbi:GNAT family N-acetyltransferase [Ferirhizobium litorale]|nr:GNAT family N-acetyltransferase [Fererhizobium litorale]
MKPSDKDPFRRRSLVEDLTIRAMRPSDVEAVTALVNLPNFRYGTLRLPHQTVEETRRRLEPVQPGHTNLVAVIGDAIVGDAGMTRFCGRRTHAAALGMGVHDSYIGKGIGSALLGELIEIADNWLDLKRLELTVYADNDAAIRLYERFGFEKEGLLRAFGFRAGKYVDAYTMARLKF